MGSADDAPSTSAPDGNGTPRPPRVLSIQSHVVSGYVGNKAAVFPLQVWHGPLSPFASSALPLVCLGAATPLACNQFGQH